MAEQDRVVVGLDGSDEALAALRWALREGAVRRAAVDVVHCWQPQNLSDAVLTTAAERQRASICMVQAQVSLALADITPELLASGLAVPTVTETSVAGRASHVLIDRSAGAATLVLGTHGRTVMYDRVFGQVGASCLKHASCTVVVVDRDGRVEAYQDARLTAV